MRTVTLANAPLATPLTLCAVPTELRHQLSRLGLRPGAGFAVVRRSTGGGRIVSVSGARVAIGRPVLARLEAEVV
ncbi:FeoA domain-containing protein [Micropruina sp.]|uniref:FeoA domain-containing protein n=1 Tax=Micropruina sp. TaxID=2737536 RepID=UPI0039E435E0